MRNTRRADSIVSVCSVILLLWWVFITGLNTTTFWQIALSIILGSGLGLSFFGGLRGSRICILCFIIMLLATIFEIVLATQN